MNAPTASITVRQASLADGPAVTSILREAAGWLEARGMPLWRKDELSDDVIAGDVEAGLFWIADVDGEPGGTVRLQFSDPEFWPDVPEAECVFLHRLAVRRRFAGGVVSSALMSFALDLTRGRNRRLLCLDCEVERPRLRAIYERFGFAHHSDRHVGPYFVSRYTMRADGSSASRTATAARVTFDGMAWQPMAAGARHKVIERSTTRVRLVELTGAFREVDWCTRTHAGCVLEGDIEFEFVEIPGRVERLTAGDMVFLSTPHKARAISSCVRLFLVEDLVTPS